MARTAEVIISVCPPHAAREVAQSVAGFEGTYVDANAISPATAREIGGLDGGIIGPPPREGSTTRLYLSGPGAQQVADLFAGTAVDARVLGDEIGAASALKMTFAAWSKERPRCCWRSATWRAPRAWRTRCSTRGGPGSRSCSRSGEHAESAAGRKGWRWVGEMEEIADTFAAAGQPEGFHRRPLRSFEREE